MEPNANCTELMESVFENELLLANIFSWLDLKTIKMVRLINTKWTSVARKRFSEISLVFIRLKFDLSLANTRVQVDLNEKTFLTLWLDDGNDILTPLNDQLAPFKNFKLVFVTYAEQVVSDERMEEAYFCLNQLIRALWRPNGSLNHSVAFFQNISQDLLHSIIEGYNGFSHVEIEAGEYIWFINTSQLPKMSCHTIRINPTTFPLTVVPNVFSHYVNTKKIIFEDASLINLDTVVRAIIEKGEQFGKLEEIDVTIQINFDQLRALAGLRGLKRLKIRIADAIISENPIPALQECIARHAPTLEFLHLELNRCRVTSVLSKFESIEFPKLRRLYFGKNLAFEGVAEHEVDLFDLQVAMQVEVVDIRFPTSLEGHGSDAMHTDPDYSCAYVTIHLAKTDLKGYGLTFTCGRGTEIVVQAVKTMSYLVEGENCQDIWNDFAGFYRKLTSESQLRWVGPEKGVVHLATGAIINALWDLWARYENKPVWKLLVDLSPEKLVSTIDFRYIRDVLSPEECISMLKEKSKAQSDREKEICTTGYPAYTTSVGWLGYTDENIQKLCQEYLDKGFTSFKVKVGQCLEDDKRRCKMVRSAIGPKNNLMIDANQRWEVPEAIEWVTALQEYKPLWIEEPTSPDDVLGHATIAKALKPLGINVATGEMCQNRVIFKQLLQANAIAYAQIDSCRVGGVNENLSIYFMCKKFGVPVCPHAGGVGLCELVQHLQFWDYLSLSGEKENRMIEWVDHLHEHFVTPITVINGKYIAPTVAGFSSQMKEESIAYYQFPKGTYWENRANPDHMMLAQ